jgi:hypothetical protein
MMVTFSCPGKKRFWNRNRNEEEGVDCHQENGGGLHVVLYR